MAGADDTPLSVATAGPSRQRNRRKLVVLAAAAIVAIPAGWEFYRVALGSNVHTVIPGKVYRSAQPDEAMLKQLIRDHGIRTVVNLRGTGPSQEWYKEESRATCELDLNQEDINLSARRLPSASELRQLIDILDRVEYPILLHCQRGADRTGLASAVVMLLQEGVSFEDARGYLSWRFGHVELGRPAWMADFFDCYDEWLRRHGVTHRPEVFRRWVKEDYRGGGCCCEFQKWEFSAQPIRAYKPVSMTVRVHNCSTKPWQLNPLPTAGVHLHYFVIPLDGRPVLGGRAGMMDGVVEPGTQIDLKVQLPPLPPGAYRLALDMVDEQMGAFFQMGSEPLELRLDVVP
jgi:protein tyrosine phosphatase (PTP) superfamily phosphohydrolase (DUF442 family)